MIGFKEDMEKIIDTWDTLSFRVLVKYRNQKAHGTGILLET